MDNYPASLEAAEQALLVNAESTEGLFLRASALMALHEYTAARETFDQVLSLDPEHVNALTNLGSLLGNLHDHRSAVEVYQRVLALDAGMWQARHNLGTSLHALKQFEKAREILAEVWAENPLCWECALSLANALRELKRMPECKDQYEAALALNPHSREAFLHYYTTLQEMVDWDSRDDMIEAVVEATLGQLAEGSKTTVSPYFSLLSPFPPDVMLGIARSHALDAARKVASLAAELALAPAPLPRPPNTLRVAYMMADFRQHVTAHLLQTVFSRHDASRVEAHGVALNADDGGAFRRSIAASFGPERFHEAYGMSDTEAAVLLNSLGVHVIVDMDYHKDRIAILALRAARVQVTWLAHPGTTGADFIDHIVIDHVTAPPELAPFISEGLVYMKHHYQINDHKASYPHSPIDKPRTRAREGLPQDAFVIANFNGLYKIEPAAFDLWLGVVRSVAGSALWLVSDGKESDENIRQIAGEVSGRVVLAARADFGDHIARAAAADLFLDSFTYNAHTTAVDALWGGVPVVTLPGPVINSRLAAGALGALGPGSETLVRTAAEYQELALRLASHPRALARLRRWLALGGRGGLESRPLFDTEGWFRDWEGCLLLIADLAALRGEGAPGRPPHVVRGMRPEWRWRMAAG